MPTMNPFNCECGGLRHICERHGHLPGSLSHYRQSNRAMAIDYEVVWSGTTHRRDTAAMHLLAADGRQEHPDSRLWAMPTYDLDDGEVIKERSSRRYTLTGRHVGKCSRTNPNAPQYIPRVRTAAVAKRVTSSDTRTEESDHG